MKPPPRQVLEAKMAKERSSKRAQIVQLSDDLSAWLNLSCVYPTSIRPVEG